MKIIRSIMYLVFLIISQDLLAAYPPEFIEIAEKNSELDQKMKLGPIKEKKGFFQRHIEDFFRHIRPDLINLPPVINQELLPYARDILIISK